MDIVEYAEAILGTKLMDYQKEMLYLIKEADETGRPLQIMFPGRGQSHTNFLRTLLYKQICESYRKENQ